MLTNKIKLVIWDLDETFWQGTLSEEGVKPVQANLELIKTLTDRGIVNAISSKNTFEDAKAALQQLAVWDYFVFPKIAWEPKGPHVKATLEEMGLRPVNCLFIDDNHLNRQEVSRFCEGIQTAHPDDVLSDILDSPYCQGQPDSHHNRLQQYKVLEDKVAVKVSSGLSNIEFLKDCDIQIRFEVDVLSHLDRIYELIERTNQLNYTKVRLATEKEKTAFKQSLEYYQHSAALVYAKDKYGDYGAVGFYLLYTDARHRVLKHFVFSCRTLNMGIEAFVYDYLGQPKLTSVAPVAYPVDHYKQVDWVTVVDQFEGAVPQKDYSHILALGPCNLLQMANFLQGLKGYFHKVVEGVVIKYDCPGFFLSRAEDVEKSSYLASGKAWSKADYYQFREDLKKASIVVLDLADLMLNYPTISIDNLLLRDTSGQGVRLPINQRADLLVKCVESVLTLMPANAQLLLFDRLINAETNVGERGARLAFRELLSQLNHSRLKVINMSGFHDASVFNDGAHLNRSGYQQLAKVVSGEAVQKPIANMDYRVFENLVKRLSPLNDEHINQLRDAAVAFEQAGDIERASQLMMMAEKLRPKGDFIRKKAKEYRERLLLEKA